MFLGILPLSQAIYEETNSCEDFAAFNQDNQLWEKINVI